MAKKDNTDITRVAADLIDAFNQADWDTLRTFVAPDLVYAETGTGRRLESADAYIEALEGWKQSFPDLSGTILAAVASDDTVAQRILWEGTHQGPMPTPAGPLEASGNRISGEASAWYRFEGGTVSEIHHHLDVLTLLQQIGALPAPPQ